MPDSPIVADFIADIQVAQGERHTLLGLAAATTVRDAQALKVAYGRVKDVNKEKKIRQIAEEQVAKDHLFQYLLSPKETNPIYIAIQNKTEDISNFPVIQQTFIKLQLKHPVEGADVECLKSYISRNYYVDSTAMFSKATARLRGLGFAVSKAVGSSKVVEKKAVTATKWYSRMTDVEKAPILLKPVAGLLRLLTHKTTQRVMILAGMAISIAFGSFFTGGLLLPALFIGITLVGMSIGIGLEAYQRYNLKKLIYERDLLLLQKEDPDKVKQNLQIPSLERSHFSGVGKVLRANLIESGIGFLGNLGLFFTASVNPIGVGIAAAGSLIGTASNTVSRDVANYRKDQINGQILNLRNRTADYETVKDLERDVEGKKPPKPSFFREIVNTINPFATRVSQVGSKAVEEGERKMAERRNTVSSFDIRKIELMTEAQYIERRVEELRGMNYTTREEDRRSKRQDNEVTK